MNCDMSVNDIKLSLNDFKEKVGIETGELWEEAIEFCDSFGGLSDEEFDHCQNRFIEIAKEVIVDASEPSFEAVDLDISLDKDEVTIAPKRDWEASGKQITEIVDGYMGILWSPDQTKYETLKYISSAESDKELVESHLHWVKNYAELYGAHFSNPKKRFEILIDERLRYNLW